MVAALSWVARELNAVGLSILPIVDTIPAGLLLDLGWGKRPNEDRRIKSKI
jgi:hypothetical protein